MRGSSVIYMYQIWHEAVYLNYGGGFAVDGELNASWHHYRLALAVPSGRHRLDLSSTRNVAPTAVLEGLPEVLEARRRQA